MRDFEITIFDQSGIIFINIVKVKNQYVRKITALKSRMKKITQRMKHQFWLLEIRFVVSTRKTAHRRCGNNCMDELLAHEGIAIICAQNRWLKTKFLLQATDWNVNRLILAGGAHWHAEVRRYVAISSMVSFPSARQKHQKTPIRKKWKISLT